MKRIFSRSFTSQSAHSSTEYFYALNEAAPKAIEHTFGGKARSLRTMHELGLRVPEGFVISSQAFARFSAGFEKLIARQLKSVDARDPKSAERVSKTLEERILKSAHLPEFDAALEKALERAPAGPYIVRSSALGEDSKEASFAGQLDSYFPIEKHELKNAIKRCWASAFSARSLSYQAQKGVRLSGVAVVVQSLVQSQHAGVLFTNDTDLRGEYVHGFGEALVSGRVTPGRFRVHRDSAKAEHLSRHVLDAPALKGSDAFLSERAVHELARGAVACENHFSQAVDIEWATSQEGDLYFVQVRPVTAPECALWSNTNVCENFPQALTPFLYSVVRRGYANYFRNLALAFGLCEKEIAASNNAFEGIVGLHQSKLYYNLTNIHAVFRLAPFGDVLANSFNLFVGAQKSAELSERSVRQNITSLTKLVAFGTRAFSTLEKRISRFEKRVDDFASVYTMQSLKKMSALEIEKGIARFLDIRENKWLDASLCDGAAMLSYGALKYTISLVADDDEGALHSVLTGLDNLASAAPVSALYALSQTLEKTGDGKHLEAGYEVFRAKGSAKALAAYDAYIRAWGFRGSGELMLTEASFLERPETLVPILKRYLKNTAASPQERLLEQKRERKKCESALRKRFVGKLRVLRKPFDALLRMTHYSIACRERARLKQALLYSRLRLLVLALGQKLEAAGHIDDASDVFFLDVREAQALVHSRLFLQEGVRALIAARKQQFDLEKDVELPETFTLALGKSAQAPMQVAPTRVAKEGEYLGVAASSGRVRGKAAVLKDLSESELLGEHDLLVTKQTDPGWAPLFFLIDGLVMERGGMLSHGSILAREFGIPSVVGIDDVTGRLAHGMQIEIDGDKGLIRHV